MYTQGKKYFDQRKLIPRSKAIREYVIPVHMYTQGKKYFDQRKLIPRSKAIREYVKTTCYCQHFFSPLPSQEKHT